MALQLTVAEMGGTYVVTATDKYGAAWRVDVCLDVTRALCAAIAAGNAHLASNREAYAITITGRYVATITREEV